MASPLWGGDGTPGRVDPFHCRGPSATALGWRCPLWGGDGTPGRVDPFHCRGPWATALGWRCPFGAGTAPPAELIHFIAEALRQPPWAGVAPLGRGRYVQACGAVLKRRPHALRPLQMERASGIEWSWQDGLQAEGLTHVSPGQRPGLGAINTHSPEGAVQSHTCGS